MTDAIADTKLRGDVENHLAMALLIADDVESARNLIDAEISDSSNVEIDLERRLIRGMVALRQGNAAAAATSAADVAARARENGYLLYATPAARLAQFIDHPLPLNLWPRCLYVVGRDRA